MYSYPEGWILGHRASSFAAETWARACSLVFTQRLQSSSVLVTTYLLLRGYNIQPKKEPHWSPWVGFFEGLLTVAEA